MNLMLLIGGTDDNDNIWIDFLENSKFKNESLQDSKPGRLGHY
jgi:hypothetical protein